MVVTSPAESVPLRKRRPGGGLILATLVMVAFAATSIGYVGFVLWPRWPDRVAPDAPTLPITVAGVTFNVPPAAVRVAVQRHAGAQERIDLVFLWPSLDAPDLGAKPGSVPAPKITDRLFVSIAGMDDTLPVGERLKTIYPRYAEGPAEPEDGGLMRMGFRADTPYHDEDLFYDPETPERFVARCMRKSGPAAGTCLAERRIGAADITLRFPRAWLADWRAVAEGIDRLIVKLRVTGT